MTDLVVKNNARDMHRDAFNAGSTIGKGFRAAQSVISMIVASGCDKATLELYRVDFVAGFLSGSRGITEKAAREWLADPKIKKGVLKGETPTDMQRSYGAARTAWSRGAEAAGLVTSGQGKGGGRKKGETQSAPPDADKAQADAIHSVFAGACADIDDVLLRLMTIDHELQRFGKATSRIVNKAGDTGSVIRKMIGDFHQYVVTLTGEQDGEIIERAA